MTSVFPSVKMMTLLFSDLIRWYSARSDSTCCIRLSVSELKTSYAIIISEKEFKSWIKVPSGSERKSIFSPYSFFNPAKRKGECVLSMNWIFGNNFISFGKALYAKSIWRLTSASSISTHPVISDNSILSLPWNMSHSFIIEAAIAYKLVSPADNWDISVQCMLGPFRPSILWLRAGFATSYWPSPLIIERIAFRWPCSLVSCRTGTTRPRTAAGNFSSSGICKFNICDCKYTVLSQSFIFSKISFFIIFVVE